jgi:hypothetical protein
MTQIWVQYSLIPGGGSDARKIPVDFGRGRLPSA